MNRLKSQKTGKTLTLDNDGNIVAALDTGDYVELGAFRLYSFTTAITANTTVTAAPVGSLAKTSNATGRASLFVSDGTKWQFLTNA